MQQLQQNFYINNYLFLTHYTNQSNGSVYFEYLISTIVSLQKQQKIVQKQLTFAELETIIHENNILYVIIIQESQRQEIQFTDKSIQVISLLEFVKVWISLLNDFPEKTKQEILTKWTTNLDRSQNFSLQLSQALNHLIMTKIQIQKEIYLLQISGFNQFEEYGKIMAKYERKDERKFVLLVDKMVEKENIYEIGFCEIIHNVATNQYQLKEKELYVCPKTDKNIELYSTKIAEKLNQSILIPLIALDGKENALQSTLENKFNMKRNEYQISLKSFIQYIYYFTKKEIISDDDINEMIMQNKDKLLSGQIRGLSCPKHINRCECSFNDLHRTSILIKSVIFKLQETRSERFESSSESEE